MKKLTLLVAGSLYACTLPAQPSFQTSLEAGISLPLNSNNVNSTHTGKAVHFGNHLNYTLGNGAVRVGLGAYIGYVNSISTDTKYIAIGEAIAERYRFPSSELSFHSTAFKSTQVLLGPVASFGSGRCSFNIWAKGGYGLNEPSTYAVLYKANGLVNNVYLNQAGENKNSLAYSAGAGVRYAISPYVGLQLSAAYFNTQTDQVNYNFDREKGITPLYYTASNQFIQASAGLQFVIGNPVRKNKTVDKNFYPDNRDTGSPAAAILKIKTKSNIKNDRVYVPDQPVQGQAVLKIKTKSNIKNDRLANNTDDNADNDSLFFSPNKIELRTAVGRTEPLQAVGNYLTGFLYQTPNGTVISQCGSNAMPGDPLPGINLVLRREGAAVNEAVTGRTNKDGSFSFNNIAAGYYHAEAGSAVMEITVKGDKNNDLEIMDIKEGSCGAKGNYIISAGDKTYVEVIGASHTGTDSTGKHISNVKYNEISVVGPRDAGSGMATGKRMHKPYLVTNILFDVNMDNIVASDGKLYAEVVGAREAGSGMATGRSTVVTGDVDGDGMTDYTVVTPRDAGSGMPTGKRMHKPMVITKELDSWEDEDAGILTPRDAGSGMPTGKRMHKPMVITKELDSWEDEDAGILTPRDAGSGMPTGKRMHKPMVITKELGVTQDGQEVEIYRVIHRDLAARNIVSDEGAQKMAITEQGVPRNNQHKKGIITGKDNDNGMFTNNDAEAIAGNPLYESNGSSGVNPMFESRDALHVEGGNGKGHDIFIPSNIVMEMAGPGAVAQYVDYKIGPVKWMSPESLSRETARKGISEKGIKRTEITAGNCVVTEISRVHCANGLCTIDAIVEVGGNSYEALITGVMKTKHDQQ